MKKVIITGASDGFGRNVRLASEKFKSATEGIDRSIAQLQKIKKI